MQYATRRNGEWFKGFERGELVTTPDLQKAWIWDRVEQAAGACRPGSTDRVFRVKVGWVLGGVEDLVQAEDGKP